MNNQESYNIELSDWERVFRSEAESDNYQVFRDHLNRLDLPDEPALLLEGTVIFVRFCVGMLMMDGRPLNDFLAHQCYEPACLPDTIYLVTFDVCSRLYGRIAVPKSLAQLDFADCQEMVGYNQFWIARADKRDLTLDEIDEFEKAVTVDLRYDYMEEELGFWFDTSLVDGVLYGYVYSVPQDESLEVESMPSTS